MFSEANGWYIPLASAEETKRQRNKRDNRYNKQKYNYALMYYCECCDRIYQRKLYNERKLKNSSIDEYYSLEVLSKYGLEKKNCTECQNKEKK